jgi:hypothetical protein
MNTFTSALKFYCNELGIDAGKIFLFTCDDLDVAGYCDKCDDSYIIKILEIQEEGEAHPLSVLAHELIHVMQYESGLLEDLPNGLCKWKGKIYLDCSLYDSLTLYGNSPWEHQAFALQDRLYNKFLRSGQ